MTPTQSQYSFVEIHKYFFLLICIFLQEHDVNNCKKNITLKKMMKYKFLGYKNVIRKWGHIAYDYCSHQFMTATLLSPAELLVDILYFL